MAKPNPRFGITAWLNSVQNKHYPTQEDRHVAQESLALETALVPVRPKPDQDGYIDINQYKTTGGDTLDSFYAQNRVHSQWVTHAMTVLEETGKRAAISSGWKGRVGNHPKADLVYVDLPVT